MFHNSNFSGIHMTNNRPLSHFALQQLEMSIL
jgi:hypothetical protein